MRAPSFLFTWRRHWHRWCHAPLTPVYAVLTLGLLLTLAGLVLPTGNLSMGSSYWLMLVLLGWLARLGSLPGLRGLWRATAGLALLGLSLELLP